MLFVCHLPFAVVPLTFLGRQWEGPPVESGREFRINALGWMTVFFRTRIRAFADGKTFICEFWDKTNMSSLLTLPCLHRSISWDGASVMCCATLRVLLEELDEISMTSGRSLDEVCMTSGLTRDYVMVIVRIVAIISSCKEHAHVSRLERWIFGMTKFVRPRPLRGKYPHLPRIAFPCNTEQSLQWSP